MKRVFWSSFCALLVALLFSTPSYAYIFGDESKGATIKIDERSDMTLRVMFQPRLDFGELIQNRAKTAYERESDFYFRRARLTATGKLFDNLKYNLTLDADKWEQTADASTVDLYYAYLRYHYMDELNIEIGKHKLPYSRISITSSSKQLIVDSPSIIGAAKSLFGDYGQFMLMADGKLNNLNQGEIKYYVAIADGITSGDTVVAAPVPADVRSALSAGLLYMGRIEYSPSGYSEGKKSDAHLGKGKHLTVAFNYAFQSLIEFNETVYTQDRRLWGFDISGHLEELTLQFEYISIKIENFEPGIADVEPKGWYAQAGYYIAGRDLEPVVRYESFDQNSNVSSSKEEITTVGINWYFKGHSLKLGTNFVHTAFESNAGGNLLNDDSINMLQVQGQFYF